MKVLRHAPTAFLTKTRSFLEKAEAANNLILGNALGLEAGAMTLSATPVLATVEDARGLQLAALRTPPHNLAITAGPEAAIEALAAALVEGRYALPGVIGPSDAAAHFARTWSPSAELEMRQVIYRCSSVGDLALPPGRLRPASRADEPVLTRFVQAYGGASSEERARTMVARHVAEETLYVWDDDRVVSMAHVTGPTSNGIRVTGVFTDAEVRGRGYARACVGGITRRMLENGRSFCCLFANADDPVPNALYRRVGYEVACESAMWRFPPAPG